METTRCQWMVCVLRWTGIPASYWWLWLGLSGSPKMDGRFDDSRHRQGIKAFKGKRLNFCSTNGGGKENNSRAEHRREPGKGSLDSDGTSLMNTIAFGRVSECEIVGIIVRTSPTWIVPGHMLAHMPAYRCVRMIPLHVSPAGSPKSGHLRFHNPTVCMYEHVQSSVTPFSRSKWWSTQSCLDMHVSMF